MHGKNQESRRSRELRLQKELKHKHYREHFAKVSAGWDPPYMPGVLENYQPARVGEVGRMLQAAEAIVGAKIRAQMLPADLLSGSANSGPAGSPTTGSRHALEMLKYLDGFR